MIEREQFINTLVEDVEAVKVTHVYQSAIIWLITAFIFAASLAYLTGPYRSEIGHELLSSLQFLIESSVGVISVALLIYTAFDFAIPSSKSVAQRLLWPLVVLAVWIGFYIIGLTYPSLEPVMSDKREHCFFETFIYALPLLFASLIWVRKQWPLYPKATGLLLGLAAGAVPALIMQFACLYEPKHILMQHIFPGLLVGLLGMILGTVILRAR